MARGRNTLTNLLDAPEEQRPALVDLYDLEVITHLARKIKALNERHDNGEIDPRGFNKTEKKSEGEESDIVFQGYLLAEFILARLEEAAKNGQL